MARHTTKFGTAALWRILLLVLLPVLGLAAATWVILSVAQFRSESAANQRAAQITADRLSDRLRFASTLLDHAKAEIVQRNATVQQAVALPMSSRVFSALLQLDASGIVEQVALRDDQKRRESDLKALDLSRVAALAGPAKDPTTVVPESSPLVGDAPQIVLAASLPDGRMLLGICDTRALLRDLEPGPTSAAQFLVTSARGQVIAASSSLPVTVLGRLLEANQSPGIASLDDFARATGPIAGWSVWYRDADAPAYVGWSRLRLVCLCIGTAAAGASAILAIGLARRLARPLRLLAEQAHSATTAGNMSRLPPQAYAENEDVARVLRDVFVSLRQERADRTTLTTAVKAASAPAASPEEVYSNMAAALASITSARCVLIAEWVTGLKPRARVLGARCAVPLPVDYAYELTGHPASLLTAGEPVNIPSQVSRQWPESPLLRLTGAEGYIAVPLLASDASITGHIEIIDDHDLLLTEELRAVASAIAARAMGTLERMRAQARQRESDELYAAITQDQQDVICRWTADAAVTYANDALCHLTGRTREQLLGRSLLPLVQEEDREALRSNWSGLSALRPAQTMDLRLLNEHGEPVWYRTIVRAVLDSKGRVIQYQGTARDATRLRELTAAVADIQARFDVLSENTPAAFWIVDWSTQRCIYTNAAFEKLWGLDLAKAQTASLSWTVAIHEDDRASVVRNYLLHAAEGQYSETYRVTRPDGTIVRISDRAIPMRSADGQVYRVANVAFEVGAEATTGAPSPEPQARIS